MRHTRREVTERTRREYGELDRLVKRLEPVDWHRRVPRPETKDPWTIKDALAHIVYWKEHSARVFRGEKRPPELRGLEVNAGNAVIYRRWRNRRPSDVVNWHRQVQKEVMRTLRGRPDDWFGSRDRGPNWPADFVGHSAWHRTRDIEAALPKRVWPGVKTNPSVPLVVRQVVASIRRQDWDGLKPLLHPYLHWTGRDGRAIRGRTNVLAYLASTPAAELPRQHEIRDAQIYRWVE